MQLNPRLHAKCILELRVPRWQADTKMWPRNKFIKFCFSGWWVKMQIYRLFTYLLINGFQFMNCFYITQLVSLVHEVSSFFSAITFEIGMYRCQENNFWRIRGTRWIYFEDRFYVKFRKEFIFFFSYYCQLYFWPCYSELMIQLERQGVSIKTSMLLVCKKSISICCYSKNQQTY